MNFDQTTIRVLVRKNYGECFDFYTKKIGLIPVWGDRNGPYTSFAAENGAPPCFAIFSGENMPMFRGYTQPLGTAQPDTVAAVVPSQDLDADYLRLKEAGVPFLGEPHRGMGDALHLFQRPGGELVRTERRQRRINVKRAAPGAPFPRTRAPAG